MSIPFKNVVSLMSRSAELLTSNGLLAFPENSAPAHVELQSLFSYKLEELDLDVQPFPVVKVVKCLPEPVEGTMFLVDKEVLPFCKGRADVFSLSLPISAYEPGKPLAPVAVLLAAPLA